MQSLQSAPIRVRCFGACEAWYGDRLLKIARPELLLLLAVHSITGIQSEKLADMLWDDPKDDPDTALRKPRFKLRRQLHRLVPEVTADPVPGSASHGEKVVSLDTAVVSSDAQEFTELLNCIKQLKLGPADAIEAYEAALSLYKGDLLDSPDMPNYRWMYDADPEVALTLRSDFRRWHKEARLQLAELLANGPETGLARAEELYSGLCAEDFMDERLWVALFRIHERTGSSLGLDNAVRRLRGTLAELSTDGVVDIDSVALPANLDRIVEDIRSRIGGAPVSR